MTAEIAIMNNLGVALAADSAVTLNGGQGKVYASADKVFQLSQGAPVGTMIYGAGCLVGIPWETIVKTYRRELGRREFDTVEQYALSLVQWLKGRDEIFSPRAENDENESVILLVFQGILDEMWMKIKEKEKNGERVQQDDLEPLIYEALKKSRDRVMTCRVVDALPKAIQSLLRRKFRTRLPRLAKDVFKEIPLSITVRRQLYAIAIEALTRCLGLYESGIVVAGFGAKQYQPQLVDIGIYGMIEGRPKYTIKSRMAIDGSTRSLVKPFAQGEMVYTFMEGIDPRVEKMIKESTRVLVSGIVTTLIEAVAEHDAKLGNRLRKDVRPAVKETLDKLFSNWQTEKREWHWGQITSIVASLPKDELGAMAESLVNLTKFRRRVSAEKETVGGPIDVAVITKGDGFVWVRRKHYFESTLNPRIMARYVSEGKGNETAG